MEGEKVCVVEWTIENFSCWNRDIHGDLIEGPIYGLYDTYLELFPKRNRGQEEHLVVRLRRNTFGSFVGKLSFIGSDGSLLCTQQVHSKKGWLFELPPGPTFKEVVSRIKKNEALRGDRLTLRFREKSSKDSVEYMRTTIRAFDTFFKITPDLLNHLKSSSTEISWIQYPLTGDGLKGNCALGSINLLASKDQLDHAKVELAVMNSNHKVSVHTRMRVLNNDDVVRTEENEYLFLNAEKWTFSNTLTIEEVAEDGFSLILHFKIIPPVSCVHSVDLRSGCTQAFSTIPPIGFRHLSSIAPKENISKILTDVSNQPDNSFKILSKELMCLYQDQDFSDFQLKCGDVSIPVHKNILSARSPVFKTMLTTDMQEAASGCMDIVDLDPSTLGLFLNYLYTGTVEELQGDSALKLYYAADKYQVPSLNKKCADFLCANVSVSNVCDILSLADKYQDDQLTSVAHDFFLGNYNEVLRSKEWKSFMESEPLLAVKIVTHFGDKNYVTRNKAT